MNKHRKKIVIMKIKGMILLAVFKNVKKPKENIGKT